MKIITNFYNLPPIDETGLDQDEIDHRKKYQRWYISIIDTCKSMTADKLSGYNERHHILPKCMGGDNHKDNLVLMPVRYHIVAHLCLAEAYPDVRGTRVAAHCMFQVGKPERILCASKMFSSQFIAEIRQKAIENMSGENSVHFGKHRSEETKEKLRQANLGKKMPPEVCAKIGRKGPLNHNYGKPLPEETKEKIRQAHLGKKVNPDVLWKWSACKMGIKKGKESLEVVEKKRERVKRLWQEHPEYWETLHKQTGGAKACAKKVKGPDGTIYDCLLDAVKASGIPSSTLRGWMKGLRKDNHGWSYVDPKNAVTKKRINGKLV